MSRDVTQTEALELIAAYGGDVARWPLEARTGVLALAGADPVVAAALADAQALDTLLAGWAADVPGRQFEAAALIPMSRELPPARRLRARWFAGGTLAASVAAALLLVMPGQQLAEPAGQEFAGQVSSQVSLGLASGQAVSMDDFALIFTPTADEEELI